MPTGKTTFGGNVEIQVKITCPCVYAEYGQLKSGDIIRCSKAQADLLVNDYKVAIFDIKAPAKPIKK